jgi:hypothetical protein
MLIALCIVLLMNLNFGSYFLNKIEAVGGVLFWFFVVVLDPRKTFVYKLVQNVLVWSNGD